MDPLPVRRSAPYKSQGCDWGEGVKQFFLAHLERIPWLKTPVIRIWYAVRRLFWKCRWALVRLTAPYDHTIDIDKVYWISPSRITYSALQEFNIRDFKGRVIGGDWDKLEKRFCELDIYQAFKEVCLEGRRWQETVFYQRSLEALAAGQILWECRNQSEFEQRCQRIEALFHTIQQEGYKSQAELIRTRSLYDPMQVDEEVIVSVGRHGDLLFSDGAHRLAIASLLGIPRIPVKIAVRHPVWVETGGERTWMERIEAEDADSEGYDDERL